MSIRPHEQCPNVLEDFLKSERAAPCATCEGLGQIPGCLGLHHLRQQGAGSANSLGFEALLSLKEPNYNRNLIPRCRMRFNGLVQQAVAEQNGDIALEAYRQTESLPQTQTEILLSDDFGYTLADSIRGTENLVICFKEAAPHILKSMNEKESMRAKAFFGSMQVYSTPKPASLVNFQICAHGNRNFMIMPFYASTVEPISFLSIASGFRLYNQISDALRFIHSLGFNHMDIKPSNICVRENGDFVLIDMGSVVRIDECSESTVCYVPSDFQPRIGRLVSSSRYQADARGTVDWLMLAMTIAEKVFRLDVGSGSTPSPSMTELYKILRADDKSEPVFTDLLSILKNCIDEAKSLSCR